MGPPCPTEGDAAALTPVMSEIFFGAAKVLLASVVHGPYPRGELMSTVHSTLSYTIYPLS